MSYDGKCLQLARDFLGDCPHLTERESRAKEMAQMIQDAIEGRISSYEAEDVAAMDAARAERKPFAHEHLEDARVAADIERKRAREDGR